MNRKVCLAVVAIISSFALPVILHGPAFAAEFSATLVRSGGGEEAGTSTVYLKGDLRREEVKEDDGEGVMIYRPDKGVVWTLMPDEKMYMEVPLQPGMSGAYDDMKSLDAAATPKVLGKETLNGFECEKRRYIQSNLARGSITVWYSPKLGYPVKIHIKTDDKDTEMVMEYKDIKTGKIPASKFDVPADYQKMSIPGMAPGMPGGMPGGMPTGMPEMPGMGD